MSMYYIAKNVHKCGPGAAHWVAEGVKIVNPEESEEFTVVLYHGGELAMHNRRGNDVIICDDHEKFFRRAFALFEAAGVSQVSDVSFTSFLITEAPERRVVSAR